MEEDQVEDAVEVEVEGEAPSSDEKFERAQEAETAQEPRVSVQSDDDELDNYSNKVQARIKKLTEKYRKEERDREEATRLAEQLLAENQQLKGQVQNLDKGFVAEYGNRLESQEAAVKQAWKQAYESGDADAIVNAQEALARIAVEKDKHRSAKLRTERQPAPVQQERPVQQPAQQPARRPDPKAEEWAKKNDWFGSDDIMTYAVFGLHNKLVSEEGFDPDSDEYYTEVDRRIRAEFPHKFETKKKSSGAQVASAGASASRSTTKSGRRSVKLSPSQIAMAKRLNVPLEEYAKFVKD